VAAFSKLEVLIIGVSGFLGSNLTTIFQDHFPLAGTFCYHSPQIKNCQTFPLDLTDALAVKRVIAELKPEVVIHTAALFHPDMCEQAPERACHINVTGTENLLSCLYFSIRLLYKLFSLLALNPAILNQAFEKLNQRARSFLENILLHYP